MRWRRWVVGGAAVVALGAIGAGATRAVFDEQLGVDVGDCIPDMLTADDAVEDLDTVPCSEPHAGEVFALVRDVAGDAEPYPGAAAMMRRAYQDCVDAFPAYAGTTLSRAGLVVMALWPSDRTWEQKGDRTTICFLRAVDGDLVGSRRGESPDGPLPPERSIATFTVGDCFSSQQLSAGEAAAAVELVDCATPHTFEVFAFTDAPDDVEFEELEDFAERSCLELFESYVGVPYESSVLEVAGFLPRTDDWNLGDRRSFCLANHPSRDLVGTVRNTNR